MPSEDDWLVLQAILEVLQLVIDMVRLHQHRDFWLLWDAADNVLQIDIMMEHEIEMLRNGGGPLP